MFVRAERQKSSCLADSSSGANVRDGRFVSICLLRQQLTKLFDRGCEIERLARTAIQAVGDEFERAMIRERTTAGLALARAEGRIGGRRKMLDASKRRCG